MASFFGKQIGIQETKIEIAKRLPEFLDAETLTSKYRSEFKISSKFERPISRHRLWHGYTD